MTVSIPYRLATNNFVSFLLLVPNYVSIPYRLATNSAILPIEFCIHPSFNSL